jgi:hypothetical protein
MKKTIALVLLVACLVPAFAQNMTGIEKWIINYPKGRTDFQGFKITRCVVETTGALIELDRGGTTVRLNLIKPVALDALNARFDLVEKTVLNASELATDKWDIGVKECEIDFGLKDEMTTTLKLSSFRFRVTAETILELIGRLDGDPVFWSQAQAKTFTYSLRFRAVDPGTGNRDAFPGWPAYVAKLAQWFQKGQATNNQETMAIILETKAMKFEDKQAQKRIVLSKDDRSNLWIGMDVNYLMSNVLSGEPFGIYANLLSYHLIQPMVYLTWRNLGDPTWLNKPYQFAVTFGGFLEFNAGYFAAQEAGDYVGYPTAGGSFLFAYGPAAGIEFTAMIPRITNDKYSGDLFGIGIELLLNFNLPYFFPDYAYEYFLVSYVNFIIHVLPIDGIGVDVIAGFDMAFATPGFDETVAGIYVEKFGFSIGARFKLDIFNFFKSNEMFQ